MTDWDACRWDRASGHYESWFQRANHPTRPLAFWIRHTIFCPKGRPQEAQGELWSMWFDGEKGHTVAAKTEVPVSACSFGVSGLAVRLPQSSLLPGALRGQTERMAWDLTWATAAQSTQSAQPSLLLPERLYSGSFPKAKALCVNPLAMFGGRIRVDGMAQDVDGWVGSHNHNWGSQHTDRYAWAQVCGFDAAPDVFLECATAQIKLGPFMTPKVTVVVLSVGQERFEINSIVDGLRASARIEGFDWQFTSRAAGVAIEVQISAASAKFAGLCYRNPPGGAKACLNSKIARCTVTLRTPTNTRTFTTQNRAAFEILCERDDPRVALVGGLSV